MSGVPAGISVSGVPAEMSGPEEGAEKPGREEKAETCASGSEKAVGFSIPVEQWGEDSEGFEGPGLEGHQELATKSASVNTFLLHGQIPVLDCGGC